MNFDALLLGAKKVRASDIHLMEDQAPFFRINGDLKKVEIPPINHKEIHEILHRMMPHHLLRELESQRGCDFSYQLGNDLRFRCVAYYSMGKLGIVMRLIPMKIPTIEELQLPDVLKTIARNPRGMILLTGMTGSGKSTTLAAMLDYVNEIEASRIITIEDPIEYVYVNKKSVISQREVGKDVPDFNVALRQAMRMDPDIILVGEMRDCETIRVAIKAAETGHLVMSTLHTTSAVHTVQRIIGYFPENEHDLLREQLSLNLKASITQRLVKRADGTGRIAAMEIMVVNSTIAKLIRENRIPDIFSVIKGRDDGMRTFDQALADLVRDNIITFDEGAAYCEDFFAYKRFVAGIMSTGDKGAIIA
ncbi:MAG: PilT/PilU family type 4a pilus ATPase [Candidatus Hydrogenedentota bacterium]|uniref:Type IV pilus retraction ATPase PilT n=1 Tax=Sumerlaea chitinivorans TaxID=2250252 RepID=A0A2Z4Y584_SUMC1|nr:Type IV pilus retraction ATPase PilT [Candidatus Sumerlaea chitinivorans]RMH29555.1 MAG: PilT/PilU family type 4a pilus ATPase [Candidatus Hydrogenedentota bacterium]GIX45114.1 MAG: twitching motility protein PilT [Candidatus Sumerlaea sp.]